MADPKACLSKEDSEQGGGQGHSLFYPSAYIEGVGVTIVQDSLLLIVMAGSWVAIQSYPELSAHKNQRHWRDQWSQATKLKTASGTPTPD